MLVACRLAGLSARHFDMRGEGAHIGRTGFTPPLRTGRSPDPRRSAGLRASLEAPGP